MRCGERELMGEYEVEKWCVWRGLYRKEGKWVGVESSIITLCQKLQLSESWLLPPQIIQLPFSLLIIS